MLLSQPDQSSYADMEKHLDTQLHFLHQAVLLNTI